MNGTLVRALVESLNAVGKAQHPDRTMTGVDQAREYIREIEQRWAQTPQPWLDGKTPDQYFAEIESPAAWMELLTAWAEEVGDQSLPSPIEGALLKQGKELAPQLIAVLADESTWDNVAVGKGNLPILAARLIEKLRTAEAVPALLHIAETIEEFTLLGDAAVYALREIGEPAREGLYTICERHKGEVDGTPYTRALEILTRMGTDDRTWTYLKHGLRETKGFAGLYGIFAGDYGDKRAVFYLNQFLEERDELDRTDLQDCLESLEMLGGIPTDVARARVAARSQSAPAGKVGRNDPCPCGSGKKYKKCCGK